MFLDTEYLVLFGSVKIDAQRLKALFNAIKFVISNFLIFCCYVATIAAFDRMKKEFEFNISTSINFELLVNSSQSMQDAAQQIMEEVSEELVLLKELKALLTYTGFFMLLFIYLQFVLPVNHNMP